MDQQQPPQSSHRGLGSKFAPTTHRPPTPPQEPPSDPSPTKYISSSIRLTKDVIEILERARTDQGLAAGEFIIQALETTIPTGELDAKLHPRGTVGGGLFATRAVDGPRENAPTAATRAVAVRLLPQDLEVLDALVAAHHAGSRPKLINAAIRAYHDHCNSTEDHEGADQ